MSGELLSLPPELLEQILLELDPVDVAVASQTCRLLYAIINAPGDLFWRKLYLRQPFDDPADCTDPLGFPLPSFNYKTQLQLLTRARAVAADPALCREHEHLAIVQALLTTALATPLLPNAASDALSTNLAWLAARLRSSTLLDDTGLPGESDPEKAQARAHLHTLFGLTAADHSPAARRASRARVYGFEWYTARNAWGPFRADLSGRVDWCQVRALQHVLSMQLVPEDAEPGAYTILPMSLPFVQRLAPGEDLEDWAGVCGRWQFAFSFVDHRVLWELNNIPPTASDIPLAARRDAIFSSPEFIEVFGGVETTLTFVRAEPAPAHPKRPTLHFKGRGANPAGMTMEGWVGPTPDGHVRWHFTSGQHGNHVWSCEGVQVGGVRSMFGVLGVWTTVDHDFGDPVGPFWMRKLPDK